MNEAEKTRAVRGKEFYDLFLSGRVLDIGSGSDLVISHAEPFDLQHGDANDILRFKSPASYDSVHSSHCLEHMHDPRSALDGWWALVKPGGFLIIVVPDMELYEQGMWPSLFNTDHKCMFTLNAADGKDLPVLNIETLVQSLPKCSIIQIRRQDEGYNHRLTVSGASRLQQFLGRVAGRMRRDLYATRFYPSAFDKFLMKVLRSAGIPIDQTVGPAMAQIEIIAQKRND